MATRYSIPNRPSGREPRHIEQITQNFEEIISAINNFDGGNLRTESVTAEKLSNAILEATGINTGTVRRGKLNIATAQSRTNVAYGYLETADKITVHLPTESLIGIGYQATWQESVAGAGRAAIFIGANQLKVAPGGSAVGSSPTTPEANTSSAANVNLDLILTTYNAGLISEQMASAVGYTGDVTTGQALGSTSGGGPCFAFAREGTYEVGVQFKATSGTITAKNRKLWVWTLGF